MNIEYRIVATQGKLKPLFSSLTAVTGTRVTPQFCHHWIYVTLEIRFKNTLLKRDVDWNCFDNSIPTDFQFGLARTNYLQKLTALYSEFLETGTAERLGVASAADLADRYPSFYWNCVQPYIGDALDYLRLTQEGKQWIANLHSHVFAIENDQFRFGPFPGEQ